MSDRGLGSRERPSAPKISWVAPPVPYTSSAGDAIPAADIDIVARVVSMRQLHHAFTGTGAIALAVAAAIPDTIVGQTRVRPIAPLVVTFTSLTTVRTDGNVAIRYPNRAHSRDDGRVCRRCPGRWRMARAFSGYGSDGANADGWRRVRPRQLLIIDCTLSQSTPVDVANCTAGNVMYRRSVSCG